MSGWLAKAGTSSTKKENINKESQDEGAKAGTSGISSIKKERVKEESGDESVKAGTSRALTSHKKARSSVKKDPKSKFSPQKSNLMTWLKTDSPRKNGRENEEPENKKSKSWSFHFFANYGTSVYLRLVWHCHRIRIVTIKTAMYNGSCVFDVSWELAFSFTFTFEGAKWMTVNFSHAYDMAGIHFLWIVARHLVDTSGVPRLCNMSANHRQTAFAFICILLFCQALGHSHSHDHDHGHAHEEPPSFKYSRQANEAVEHGHAHDHDHHDHGHGHSHDHHGHGHHHKHGHQHSHEHHEENHVHDHHGGHEESAGGGKMRSRDTGCTLWLIALGSTALISAAPVLILVFIPLENTKEHQPFLKVRGRGDSSVCSLHAWFKGHHVWSVEPSVTIGGGGELTTFWNLGLKQFQQGWDVLWAVDPGDVSPSPAWQWLSGCEEEVACLPSPAKHFIWVTVALPPEHLVCWRVPTPWKAIELGDYLVLSIYHCHLTEWHHLVRLTKFHLWTFKRVAVFHDTQINVRTKFQNAFFIEKAQWRVKGGKVWHLVGVQCNFIVLSSH